MNKPDAVDLETVPITDWWIFRRLQDVHSARRVNLVRGAALVLLYAAHWIAYFVREPGGADEQALLNFHKSVHWLALAGLALVVGVALCLRSRFFPPFAKYLATLADVALVTAVAAIGRQADSGMVICYVLIIAMAFLRFSRQFIAFTAVACVGGYLSLVGSADDVWFDGNHVTPVNEQLTTVFVMLLAGAVGWHMCNAVRTWVESKDEGANVAGSDVAA